MITLDITKRSAGTKYYKTNNNNNILFVVHQKKKLKIAKRRKSTKDGIKYFFQATFE